MSGFEVAGIVLGGIPLVISALEHYKNGVSLIQRYRRYERELQRLIRNLETEQVKLQNVCEKLLDGIVSPSLIDKMVENPGGELWSKQETQKAIRTRLWKSWDVFERTLRDIQTATDEMYDKLGHGSETSWSDMTLAAKELKRVAFALSRSAYSEHLATIRDGITNLESLATMNIELEPKRRVRSRVKLLNVLRTVVASIYRAVESNLKCSREHSVSMRLSGGIDQPGYIDEDEIIRHHQTDLLLSHNQLENTSRLLGVHRHEWEGWLLRVVPNLQRTAQISLPPAMPASPKPKRGQEGSSAVLASETQCSTISLYEVLHNEDGCYFFSYRRRLQLAVFIATSVLHLYRTPWMLELPRSKNIIFVKTHDDVIDYSRAFLKAEPTGPNEGGRNTMIPTPKLLPIGVLLVELIKGQRIESLRSENEVLNDELSALSDFMTAQRLVDDICQASSTYGSAVRRCLDVGFKAQACDVQNEDFRHNFYSGIVALLEEDLNNLPFLSPNLIMSTPTTEEPFTIFHKFPPEVQLEILRQCSEGDLVCLSLTCRDMHYLAKPLLSEKPDLSKVDQLGSTPDMPQDCMDSDYQYGTTTRRDMLLATNAEPIRLNTLFVKSQGARNTVHVFRALSSCDCATGWGVESIVKGLGGLLPCSVVEQVLGPTRPLTSTALSTTL
ncbi:unnamed protein product [Fusarium graminearum]|uniref:F-box domain-containing protein n=1 Tax=Gibberella zeae TaxID=5518 RepID=A0A4E9DWK8_GIBZA|nr:unnamed protein product [Fusarium graminearum]